MVNLQLLMQAIDYHGMPVTVLADRANIRRSTLYKRLYGQSEFKAKEVAGIQKALHLTNEQRDEIFFGSE